jgi:phosphate transport system permease protein
VTRAGTIDRAFHVLGVVVLGLALTSLALLLWDLVSDGAGRVSWAFLTGYPSRRASNAGLLPALAGTAWLIALTALMAVPVGVGAAIALEEYGGRGRWARLIEINIANLAGVPSIVYGLLGLGLFVRALQWERSLLAGAGTLALLVLPTVILTTREALRAVPVSLREASLAVGATKWQTIWHQVLPSAWPGMLTGLILALSRAIGETAPLIVVGAATVIAFNPDGLDSQFTALPIQIFDWISRASNDVNDYKPLAAAAILLLMIMLMLMNSIAIWLRNRYEQKW